MKCEPRASALKGNNAKEIIKVDALVKSNSVSLSEAKGLAPA